MNESLYPSLGYRFSDPRWLDEALTHKSAVGDGNNHYQRLEFVGDALLGGIIAESLYRRYPQADEGLLTQWRSSLVNRDFLAEVAKTLGLSEYLRVGAEQQKVRHNINVLADVIEAIVAAVYFDGGFQACQDFVLRHFESSLINIENIGSTKDAKTQLQEYLQARKWPLPEYDLILQTGPQHRPHFVVQANLPSFHSRGESPIYSALGEGDNRKLAERNAAERVLFYLRSVDFELEYGSP